MFPLASLTIHESIFPRGAPNRRDVAANDCAFSRPTRGHVADLNTLIASMLGHVSAVMQPSRVNIELRLAPNRPVARGNPTEVAFAVAGVVSAQMRALEDGEGGTLRVDTRSYGQSVRVLVTADTVPPLRIIRAITSLDPNDPTADKTVAHCRRLIEAQGGLIELTEDGGMLGFALVFPTVLLSRPTTLSSSPASHIDQHFALQAAA